MTQAGGVLNERVAQNTQLSILLGKSGRGVNRMRWVYGIVGGIVGVALAIGFVAVIILAANALFDATLVPRGLWPLFLVIAAFAGGWQISRAAGPLLVQVVRESGFASVRTQRGRAVLFSSGLYPILFAAYVHFQRPFGYSIRDEEWMILTGWFFAIPVFALAVLVGAVWVLRGERR